MNKNIQPKLKNVTFKCATCGSEFNMESAMKQDVVSIDVCSNCHPFYKGSATTAKIKGRAEKLQDRFATGMQELNKKPTIETKKERQSNKKVIKSLDDLKSE